MKMIILLLTWLLAGSVWDGAYTAEQATRGRRIFNAQCIRCHASEQFSSAEALALKGPLFMERWREDTAQNLFNKMKGYMPPSASGGASIKLPDQDYLDIIAYLFQSNEFPVGAAELKLAALESVQITGKDGPRPVPNLATVKVVGCLGQTPNGRWSLTKVTEPVRTREPESSTPAELTASGGMALGSLTFELRSIDTIGTFDPDKHKGHKVQVKGVLYREPANRVTVLSAESVGAVCGG